ncbi:MAG: cyanophycinase, partial [Planctomycetota bacterium]
GRQWRFVDAYEGTRFEASLRALLDRGGVIGGSSAGATILGEYLCRGGPLGNVEIMVPGYDRGFAYLKGVGIDQHFTQRKRFSDMERFTKARQDFLGIGIDEATALVVTPQGAEVLGPGKVHIYQGGKSTGIHASGEKVRLSP